MNTTQKRKPDAHRKIIDALDNRTQFAFLSSLTRTNLSLRKRINDLNDEGHPSLPVYVDECMYDAEGDQSAYTVDRLTKLVELCEFAIVLFSNPTCSNQEIKAQRITLVDTGSLIALNERNKIEDITSVSFLETELLRIAAYGKKVFVLTTHDFKPGLHLMEFYRMIPWFEKQFIKCRNEDEICSTIKQILKTGTYAIRQNLFILPVKRYLLSIEKWKKDNTYVDAITLQINFGKQNVKKYLEEPNVELIDKKLIETGNEENFSRQLTLLWYAYKELFKGNYSDPEYKHLLNQWNDFYTKWARMATWYGIHGGVDLGALNFLQQLSRVREMLRKEGHEGPEVRYPAREFASEYYSMAQWIDSKYYDIALFEIQKGLQFKGGNEDSLLGVRGSIYLRKKKLFSAIDDYKRALQIRNRAGMEERKIGLAEIDLGFALALTLVGYKKGTQMMEEGISKLEDSGNKIRAYKKLSYLYFYNGNGKKYRQLAITLAQKLGATDQLRKMIEL